MSDIQLILLILVGKVCIYTIQRTPLVKQIKISWLDQLFSCSFCLGTWVYFLFSAVFHVALFKSVFYFPIASELVTGAIVSLSVFLFSIGFVEFFGTLVVGDK